MKKFLLFMLFVSTSAFAETNLEKSCSAFYERTPGLNFYRQFFKPDTCYLSVSPTDTFNMIFRSYLFSNTGAFMVFNSYGFGDDAKTTGARVYYFFPRTQTPERSLVGDTLSIQTTSPQATVHFNGETGLIEKVENAEVTEDPRIVPNNHGGVEIKNHKGLMLDVGFAQGHDPSADKNRVVSFYDHAETKCEMKAKEIFTYNDGDVQLAYGTDAELKQFLSVRCPELQFLF